MRVASGTYFIFLRKLEVVVGFQALQMIRQFGNGDGRVAGHACQSEGQRVSRTSPERAPDRARGHSRSLDKQRVCLTEGMEEWVLLGSSVHARREEMDTQAMEKPPGPSLQGSTPGTHHGRLARWSDWKC